MRLRSMILAPLAALAAAAPLHAQGSVFAFRGMGWAGRPVSARSAGTAGALSMFDPMMSLNPSSLARWRSTAGWAVSAPTETSYDGPTGVAEVKTVRFPLIGFAAVLPRRAIIGFAISDYLDRTWTVTQRDSFVVRGDTEAYTDAGRSIGGVSDMSLGVGYRLHDGLFLGIGAHYYLGSTRLTAQRVFDNTSYSDILEASLTDYKGGGIAVGLSANRGKLDFGLSGRVNSRLKSSNTSGTVVHTPLPHQVALGLRYQPVPGVYLAGNAVWDGWSRADAELSASGGEHARDVWALSGGVDIQRFTLIKLTTPLRLGYRWRQLPFTSRGDPISEWAVSGGIGFSLARDRTTIDLAAESGNRTAGPATESFKSIFVGLTVRP